VHANSSNESCALWARGFMALWLVLTMALALSAWPAEAAPIAYVTTHANNVSVIDTATNNVVANVPAGNLPAGGSRNFGWEARLRGE
jgi:YVTN family beta-propeller protein